MLRLLVPILLNCLLVLGVYLADKHTTFNKLPYMTKQTVKSTSIFLRWIGIASPRFCAEQRYASVRTNMTFPCLLASCSNVLSIETPRHGQRMRTERSFRSIGIALPCRVEGWSLSVLQKKGRPNGTALILAILRSKICDSNFF